MKLADQALEIFYQSYITTIMEKARSGKRGYSALCNTVGTYEWLKDKLVKEGFHVSEAKYTGYSYEFNIVW